MDLLNVGRDILDYPLHTSGVGRVTVATLVALVVMLVLSWWFARAMERALDRAMRRRGVRDEGSIRSIGRLIYYFVLALGFGVSLSTAGLSLSSVFAAGAVFAVGIGLAFQSLAENFVSGIFLLFDQSITSGDVLEVDGKVVRVLEMRMRTTVARTRDEEDLIIPNSVLLQNTVKNYSLKDSTYRLIVTVGVSYDSDMAVVKQVLEKAGAETPERIPDRAARAELLEFADSAVVWRLLIWIADPWRAVAIQCAVNERIWWAFREAGVGIPYPQVDVHLKDGGATLTPRR